MKAILKNYRIKLLSIICMLLLLLCNLCLNAQHSDYPIKAISFTQVNISDNFWQPRLEKNRTITIPASFEQCRITGRIRNFEMAAARSGAFCTAYPFDDTDIYKTIEGASYTLHQHPDKELMKFLDSLITLIGRAQEPDGYLYTARTINPNDIKDSRVGKERWEKEQEHSHELYNAGHLYEAAVAHFQATGKRNLLDIAIKNANLVDQVFGPGKKLVAPGHQVIEMGLIKLYRVTDDKRYLDLAKFFLEQRGLKKYDSKSKDVFRNGAYWQDHKPVAQQEEAVGHAVRAVYMYAAMADIAALTKDETYLKAIERIWENMVQRKIYLHGGLGAAGDGERFSNDYDLPNLTAYSETCAAIGNIFWNHRMFLLRGESKYIDVLEKTLYNGMLSGISMDGKSFFYTNAMEVRNHFHHPDLENARAGWFICSCCPTNVTRMIPSVPGYIYAQNKNNFYINLFVSSNTSFNLDQNKKVHISQHSDYPFKGNIRIQVDPTTQTSFRLMLRIPGWAVNQAIPGNLYNFTDMVNRNPFIRINGIQHAFKMENGYAVIERAWKKNDIVELELDMPVRKVTAHPDVKDGIGKMALQRGPLIYCAEWVDNSGLTSNIILSSKSTFTTDYNPGLQDGMMKIKTDAISVSILQEGLKVETRPQTLTVIPYFYWAHRGQGEMQVWIPFRITAIDLISR